MNKTVKMSSDSEIEIEDDDEFFKEINSKDNLPTTMTKCNYCEKVLRKTALYIHIQSMHKKVRFPCDKCKYQATQKSHLNIHIQAVHEQIRYSCLQCDYQGTRKQYLRDHVNTIHSKVRKFSCHLCTYKAGQKAHLNKHIRTVHKK